MQGVTGTPGGQLPEHLYRLFTADKKKCIYKGYSGARVLVYYVLL
jgi:hypothetical protein